MSHLMFKYRLYPTKKQEQVIEEQFELCRQTYNFLLAHCRETYKQTKKTPSHYELTKLIPHLKNSGDYKKVYSQVLQNVSKRIKDGYTGFFARRKAGLKAGLPRFKKYGTYKSITYPQFGFRIEGNKLKLSKIGNLRINLHREVQGQVKTLTVKRNASGKWFACFSCIVESKHREKPYKSVGIDVGLMSFVVLSDGSTLENPQYYRNSEKRLGRLQRSLSRKQKGSRNRAKARVKVARLHEKTRNCRTDFLHKASRQIVDRYETVIVEDLKICNMVRNHCLAKSISDAGWGRFIEMIAYKELQSGGELIKVNPANTSQLCSRCGKYVKKSLSDRVHKCPTCGLEIDRDLNASRNILKIGMDRAEYTLVGETASTQPLVVGQVGSMNQEAHGISHG